MLLPLHIRQSTQYLMTLETILHNTRVNTLQSKINVLYNTNLINTQHFQSQVYNASVPRFLIIWVVKYSQV